MLRPSSYKSALINNALINSLDPMLCLLFEIAPQNFKLLHLPMCCFISPFGWLNKAFRAFEMSFQSVYLVYAQLICKISDCVYVKCQGTF